MENETKQQGMLKPALQYGLIMALALIMLSLIFYLSGAATSNWAGWLSYPLMVVLLFIFIKKYRDDNNDGFISYGQSLGFGTLVGVFTGVIYAVYAFIFFKFIGPEVIEEMHLKIEEQILIQNPDFGPDEFELALKMAKAFVSPIFLTISSLFSYAFLSFLFSLIISIFTKKKNPEVL